MPEPEPEPDLLCVGALIRDQRHRVFVHRRTADRKLFPGLWDIVGGHVDPGETVEQALGREIEEETGWTLRAVRARLPAWDWVVDGVRRREFDFLVEVDGDLSRPRLEAGKHDAYDWVGTDNLDLMMVGRTDGDRRLRDVVATAVRTRLTERLCLVPGGPEHADEHGRRWELDGVCTWLAYDRVTGDLVGRGGLSWKDVTGSRQLEVGWALLPDRWEQGYATEIGSAGLTFGFDELGVDEIVAFTEPHDHRSRAVMERLGMRYEREFLHDGERFVLYVAGRPDQTRTAVQPSTTTDN